MILSQRPSGYARAFATARLAISDTIAARYSAELNRSLFMPAGDNFTAAAASGVKLLVSAVSMSVARNTCVFVAKFGGTIRVAVTGAKSHVFRATDIETALTQSFTPEAAAAVKLSPAGMNSDLFGSAEYRAAMVSEMASRAVAKALA